MYTYTCIYTCTYIYIHTSIHIRCSLHDIYVYTYIYVAISNKLFILCLAHFVDCISRYNRMSSHREQCIPRDLAFVRAGNSRNRKFTHYICFISRWTWWTRVKGEIQGFFFFFGNRIRIQGEEWIQRNCGYREFVYYVCVISRWTRWTRVKGEIQDTFPFLFCNRIRIHGEEWIQRNWKCVCMGNSRFREIGHSSYITSSGYREIEHFCLSLCINIFKWNSRSSHG